VIVAHQAPPVAETVALMLLVQGFVVHRAATYQDAMQLLGTVGPGLLAVVAHADLPQDRLPGTLLRVISALYPRLAVVLLSSQPRKELGHLPKHAVLLREPIDRTELVAVMTIATEDGEPRQALPAL